MRTLTIYKFPSLPNLCEFALKFGSGFDNSGEFKKEVAVICKAQNINIISGSAYHLQSQESIEQARKLFKAKLGTIQIETGTKEWAHLLPKPASIINTSSNEALPRGTTLNDVWFNRSELESLELLEK